MSDALLSGELLSCPFCGGVKASVGSSEPHDPDEGVDQFTVMCEGCGASVSLYLDSEAEAIASWNRRADSALAQAGTARVDEAAALAEFTEYFVRNYPGPDTIIGVPTWHAPKIFRAALYAIKSTRTQAGTAREAALRKVRDGYAKQAQFADPEPAAYFREFVRRIDAALTPEAPK